MIASGVHHISFSVRDLEASRRFYEGVLGLEEIPRPDLGLPGVWYRAGSSEVHLIGRPEGVDVGASPGAANPLANHQAFAIDDYLKCRDALRAAGLEITEAGVERGQMWVQDPDGNVIELIAPGNRS